MSDEPVLVEGSLLANLTEEERHFLLATGVARSFSANQTLMHQGDPSDHVLVLVAGWVKIFASAARGGDLLVGLRGPGDVLGDLAALHGWPRAATVRSLERVSTVQLRRADFLACLHARPAIAIAMTKQVATRLRESDRARLDAAIMDVTHRVGVFLLRLMQTHGVESAGGVVLAMPLSQQDIADRIGSSRRGVARATAIFRERGIISTARQRIAILRPQVLSAFCESYIAE